MLLDGPRSGLTWPVRVDPTGVVGPTSGRARGKGGRRTGPGLYVPSSVERTVDQRIVEASVLLPESCGITGWAGVHWAGGSWSDGSSVTGPRAITLATGSRDFRPPVGVELSQERLGSSEIVVIDGVSMTNVLRSVFFEMRYAGGLAAAVRVLDMACFSDLVSIAEMTTFIEDRQGWTGIDLVRFALQLADENSWSPQETNLRNTWVVLADLPRPLTNRPVFDLAGRHLATPDLLDEESGLAIEYNGEVHSERQQQRTDRDRMERLRTHGLDMLVVMAGDQAPQVADRMHVHRNRALTQRPAVPNWTVEPPPWWVATDTVAARRALSPRQRDRLLAHRRRVG